eukprot:s14948_g1.t1
MAKMSLGDFLDRYGIHTAIAALAVIAEDEAKDKKRIIHDATHGVRVNHRIKCRDKLRLTYHLLGPGFPLDMLLYADDLESMGRGAKGRRGIPLSHLYLAALGYPFEWAKTRGGFRVEWLGMETEYPRPLAEAMIGSSRAAG